MGMLLGDILFPSTQWPAICGLGNMWFLQLVFPPKLRKWVGILINCLGNRGPGYNFIFNQIVCLLATEASGLLSEWYKLALRERKQSKSLKSLNPSLSSVQQPLLKKATISKMPDFFGFSEFDRSIDHVFFPCKYIFSDGDSRLRSLCQILKGDRHHIEEVILRARGRLWRVSHVEVTYSSFPY